MPAIMAQKPFPFLALPVETRHQIYKTLFSGHEDVLIGPVLDIELTSHPSDEEQQVAEFDSHLRPSLKGAQFLRTCRQIVKEGHVVLAQLINFIVSPRATLDTIFLAGMSPFPLYKHIRKFEVRLHEDHFWNLEL
jgi:hypothetical protein